MSWQAKVLFVIQMRGNITWPAGHGYRDLKRWILSKGGLNPRSANIKMLSLKLIAPLLLICVGLVPRASLSATEVGQQLSACSLTQLSNSKLQINMNEFSGKVLYLDFWASWCPPCAKSFPFLNELHQQYYDQGLQVIGINLDEEPGDAEQFLIRYPAEFTLASDLSKQCAEELGVAAMPSSYLIDRKGVIRHIHLGFRSSETKELRAKVKQLLSEPRL